MNKSLGKYISVLLAVGLLIPIITGCQSSAVTQTTAPPTQPVAAATTENTVATTSANDLSKYGSIAGKEWVPPTVGRGTTLRILWMATPEADILQEQAKEFTDKTGINIEWDIATREDSPVKYVRELMEEAGSYDLVITGIAESGTYVGQGHYIPIEDYLTPEEAQLFYAKKWITDPRTGKMAGIPQYNNWEVLYYRSDLLNDPKEQAAFKQKYGRDLTVPKTNAELAQVAEFFNRPPDMYGYGIGGVAWSLAYEWIHYFYGQPGASFADPNGNLLFNSPQAVQAMQEMVDITKFAPPGWETMTFFDIDQLTLKGKVFAYTNWTYEWSTFQKEMPGQIAIAEPTKQGTPLSGYVALIPVKTQNLDFAVAFEKFIGAYHIQKDHFIRTGGNFPARSDVFSDLDPKLYPGIDILAKPATYGIPFTIAWYSEAYDGFHDAFFEVVNGNKTVEEAMNWLQNEKFAGRTATK